MLLAFVLPAAAIEGDCDSLAEVSIAQPEDGSDDVGLDVVPAVFFTSSDCDAHVWTLSLARGATPSVPIAETTVGASQHLVELYTATDLDPVTAYVLTMTRSGAGVEPLVVGFVTGYDKSPRSAVTPVVQSFEPTIKSSATTPDIAAAVSYTGKVDGPFIGFWNEGPELSTERTAHVMVGEVGEILDTRVVAEIAGQEGDVWCFAASVREPEGSWTPSEETCAEVRAHENERPQQQQSGCGFTTAGGFAGMAAALANRRARRPPA